MSIPSLLLPSPPLPAPNTHPRRVADPSEVTVRGPSDDAYTPQWSRDGAEPIPHSVAGMTQDDMDRMVDHYAQAARNAMEAGFDGFELHGANGYVNSLLSLLG